MRGQVGRVTLNYVCSRTENVTFTLKWQDLRHSRVFADGQNRYTQMMDMHATILLWKKDKRRHDCCS